MPVPNFYTHIAQDLIGKIEQGIHKPGDRLDTPTLAHEYGVHVRTLRRAMQQLRKDGYIHSFRGSGYFVARRTDKE